MLKFGAHWYKILNMTFDALMVKCRSNIFDIKLVKWEKSGILTIGVISLLFPGTSVNITIRETIIATEKMSEMKLLEMKLISI